MVFQNNPQALLFVGFRIISRNVIFIILNRVQLQEKSKYSKKIFKKMLKNIIHTDEIIVDENDITDQLK